MLDCLPSAALNGATLARNIPVSVTIELTRRCPLACRHCYLPETRGRALPGPELSAAQWEKILAQLARAGGLYLVFTGGEPLLRPDLPRLCASAKKLRFDVRVFSTGLGLTPALAAKLKKSGVSAFELSFYGRPAVHEGITGAPGSFHLSLRAARLLKAAGLKVRIKTPLMGTNLGQAGWLKRLAAREGFGIAFDPVIAPANDGDGSALALRLSGARLAGAVKSLASGSVPPAERPSAAPGSADFLCGAGRNVCSVDPAGNLLPCLQMPVRLGNLTRRGFEEIWKNSPWLKKWRAAGPGDLEDCRDCPDLDYCGRCPGISLLEHGDPFAPNAPACGLAAALRSSLKGVENRS